MLSLIAALASTLGLVFLLLRPGVLRVTASAFCLILLIGVLISPVLPNGARGFWSIVVVIPIYEELIKAYVFRYGQTRSEYAVFGAAFAVWEFIWLGVYNWVVSIDAVFIKGVRPWFALSDLTYLTVSVSSAALHVILAIVIGRGIACNRFYTALLLCVVTHALSNGSGFYYAVGTQGSLNDVVVNSVFRLALWSGVLMLASRMKPKVEK